MNSIEKGCDVSNLHDIPELDARGLRKFGFTTGGIVAVLFGLLLPWLLGLNYPLWPWILCGILWAWAGLAPGSLNPVYHGWMRFGLVVNAVMSRVILGVLFFLVLWPVGVVMRIVGRDPMARRFEAGLSSYRIDSRTPPANGMERPF